MDNIRLSNNTHNEIQKMIFIFNALQDGWTVRKIEKDKFEFIKDTEHFNKEIILEDCLKEYINYKK